MQGGADAIPVRLKNAILRILSRSLAKYRSYYLPATLSPAQVQPATLSACLSSHQ